MSFLLIFLSFFLFYSTQTVDVFAIVCLSGIVSRLLSTGTVLVATSNRAPEDLNQVGGCLSFGLWIIIFDSISIACEEWITTHILPTLVVGHKYNYGKPD